MFYKLLQFLILVMAIFVSVTLNILSRDLVPLSISANSTLLDLFILCILPLDVVYHNSRSVKFEKLLLPPKEKQRNDDVYQFLKSSSLRCGCLLKRYLNAIPRVSAVGVIFRSRWEE